MKNKTIIYIFTISFCLSLSGCSSCGATKESDSVVESVAEISVEEFEVAEVDTTTALSDAENQEITEENINAESEVETITDENKVTEELQTYADIIKKGDRYDFSLEYISQLSSYSYFDNCDLKEVSVELNRILIDGKTLMESLAEAEGQTAIETLEDAMYYTTVYSTENDTTNKYKEYGELVSYRDTEFNNNEQNMLELHIKSLSARGEKLKTESTEITNKEDNSSSSNKESSSSKESNSSSSTKPEQNTSVTNNTTTEKSVQQQTSSGYRKNEYGQLLDSNGNALEGLVNGTWYHYGWVCDDERQYLQWVESDKTVVEDRSGTGGTHQLVTDYDGLH